MGFTVEITGNKEVEAKLKRLGRGIVQLDKSMGEIGAYLAKYYGDEAFTSQGQVFGNTWPRLSEKYSVWKNNNLRGKPLLDRSGDMRNGFIYKAGSQSVLIGNRMPYAKYHQTGTSKMPQRQLMGLNTKNKAMIRNLISEDIRMKLASA